MKRKLLYSILGLSLVIGSLTGCQSTEAPATAQVIETKKDTIKFGTAPGPYGDMVKYAIKPSLEEKGYKVEIVEFSDYVQPNLALGKGEIDANLFQHTVYFENFKTEHQLDLTRVTNVPTASLGLYSNKYTSLDQVPDGATLTVPNDVTNLRRALKEVQNAGLIKIDETVDVAKFSEKNVIENPHNLVIKPVEAAQLPRTLDSVDIAAITGNYALAAGIDLDSAIYKETLSEEMKNIVAVNSKDKDSQFVKDILEVVESDAFHQVIESSEYQFSGFQRPEWYSAKWGK